MSDADTAPAVLVIDDERGLREMLGYTLGQRGFRVVAAASGEEALLLARRERFDAAICDIMMPGMSGVETLKELRQLSPATEVVMATGYATLETAQECMKLGAYDYIAKPYELDQIQAVLSKAVERARLKAKVEHLEAVNRLQAESLASLSHELRAPMHAVIGDIGQLLDGIYGTLPPEQEKALRRVGSHARNLLARIHNILDPAKLPAEQMALALEATDLREVAAETAAALGSLYREKGLELTLEAGGPLPAVTDRNKFKQILVHLLGNAQQFTAAGGSTLTLGLEGDGRVVVRVRDTGVGMRPEDLPAIFEEFKPLEASPTRRDGGTGRGLGIVKRLVTLLGGTIEVESAPGQGATFTVRLPRGPKGRGPAAP